MSESLLHLPLWQSNSKSSNRVGAAKARAYKVSSDIINSVLTAYDEVDEKLELSDKKPLVENNFISPTFSNKNIYNDLDKKDATAEKLEQTMNSMLASLSIKGLEEFYELTGVANPNPTKNESEADLNKSGYTVMNGSTFFKLNDSNNVEAIRMLYMAGMSIADIRRTLIALKEGDVFCVRCGKSILKFPKYEYNELLKQYPNVRAYKEYVTTMDNYTWVVSDVLSGNDSTFVLYVGQDTNQKAFLACTEPNFPIKGTLSINVDNNDYNIQIDANNPVDLLNQLYEIKNVIDIQYNKGLTFSCDYEFYFKDTPILYNLGIVNALDSLKQSLSLGYKGAYIDATKEAYGNIIIKKPEYSLSNSRLIYKKMLDNGIPKDVCDSFLKNKSIYESVPNDSEALRDIIKSEPNNDALIYSYLNNVYSKVNTRILGTTRQTINYVLKLSDSDLEYLLRYRTDVTGIDVYCSSSNECRDELIRKAESSSNGSYYSKTTPESDAWKQNTSTIRTIYVYLNSALKETKPSSKKDLLDKTYELLDGAVYYYNNELFSNQETSYSEMSLGLNIATTMNLKSSFSFAHGLEAFSDLKMEMDSKYLDKFEQDMLIIQAYLDAGLTAFDTVCGKLSKLINILNSSLSLGGNIGGNFGFNLGNLIQCSVSADLSMAIPLYIPKINELLVGLIEKVQACVNAVISVADNLLCPVQNLLDSYVNTNNFALPCSVKFDVPVISGIDAYLKSYVDALSGLKAMCKVTSRDSNWITYKASMMPNKLELLVTKSQGCKESED